MSDYNPMYVLNLLDIFLSSTFGRERRGTENKSRSASSTTITRHHNQTDQLLLNLVAVQQGSSVRSGNSGNFRIFLISPSLFPLESPSFSRT